MDGKQSVSGELPALPRGDLDDFIFAEVEYHVSER